MLTIFEVHVFFNFTWMLEANSISAEANFTWMLEANSISADVLLPALLGNVGLGHKRFNKEPTTQGSVIWRGSSRTSIAAEIEETEGFLSMCVFFFLVVVSFVNTLSLINLMLYLKEH
ncbi:hypothetical protein FRX31_014905 [Thalictrum thalictroides]|uniref:Uncharacterized protein n=1 Tax=Thalictrum thalictroides TaxID=46969 RepID=A0A7J6WF96_THATH|nr:hypothetical protein FRX31_014905 [Thalictrum thalictroides]